MHGGQQTTRTMFCGSCEHPRDPDAVFCEKCGVPFNSGEQAAAGVAPNSSQNQSSPSPRSERPQQRPRLGRSIIGGAVALILILLVYFSPHISFYQLKRAAEANDIDALKNRVDFPALREGLKKTAQDEITKTQAAESKADLLAGASSLIDTMMTPMNFARLIRGEKFAGTFAEFGNGNPGAGSYGPMRSAMGYESLGRFAVRLTNLAETEGSVVLVFTRSGVGWKLTGMRPAATQDEASVSHSPQNTAPSPEAINTGPVVANDTTLRAYAGKVPDKTFWTKVAGIFIGTLVGQGSGGSMAIESFYSSLQQYNFAPCAYDAQTDTITVTWETTAKPDETDIASGLSGVHAIAFHVDDPMEGIVATWDDSGDPAQITFYGHDKITPPDVSSITKGDLHSLPPALGQWATALIQQTLNRQGKNVAVSVE